MAKRAIGLKNIHTSFAIVDVGTNPVTGEFDVKGLVGSCFPISHDIFLTAGHVVDAIDISRKRDQQSVGVVFPRIDENSFEGVWIVDHEVLDTDIGLIRVEEKRPEMTHSPIYMPWSEILPDFETLLFSSGFGFGLIQDEVRSALLQRTLTGRHVSLRHNFRPQAWSGSPFSVYELTFPIPRYHSGSPLTRIDGIHGPCVVGMVFGNSLTRMQVIMDEERVCTDKDVTHVQNWEYFNYGLAIPSSTIIRLESTMLGMTIGEFLTQQELLII